MSRLSKKVWVGVAFGIALLLATSGAVLAQGVLQSASGDPPPSDGATPERARPAVSDDGTKLGKDHVRTRHEERFERARRPIGEQAAELAREHDSAENDVKDRATVHVSLESPLPLEEFDEQREQGQAPVPHNAKYVTAVVDLYEGYPLRLRGPADGDFANRLNSYVEMVASQGDPPDDAHPSAAKSAERRREAARALQGNVEQNAVVMGFSMDYRDFEEREDSLRSEYGIAAAEVSLSGKAMPIPAP